MNFLVLLPKHPNTEQLQDTVVMNISADLSRFCTYQLVRLPYTNNT